MPPKQAGRSAYVLSTLPGPRAANVQAQFVHRQTRNQDVGANAALLRDYRPNRRAVIVSFRYQMVGTDPNAPRQWRTGRIVLQMPYNLDERMRTADGQRMISNSIHRHLNQILVDVPTAILGYDGSDDGAFTPDWDSTIIDSWTRLVTQEDILEAVGQIPDASSQRMRGDCQPIQGHNSFRYMIDGCDMQRLMPMITDEYDHPASVCDSKCAYRMLEQINTATGHSRPRSSLFLMDNVNHWMNANGRNVGSLTDGITPEDIQAHAIEFKYGHCALDISRAVLNLYIPSHPSHHHHTACYVVVGEHCQPIVEKSVIQSIMESARNRIDRRKLLLSVPTSNRQHLQNEASERRKRRRSLDRVFRPTYERSEDREVQDLIVQAGDLELQDWEEEFSDTGSVDRIPEANPNSKKIKLPLVTELDRFHFFTVKDNLDWVEEKCKPTYREGEDTTLIHYYICTDQDNVDFLYNYLIRVLMIDPLKYARTYNGHCMRVHMQNTWWCANPNIHSIMKLHHILHPTDPFRPMGLSSYAFHMLRQETTKITKKPYSIFECQSMYPPTLQRLMDNANPANRPKLIQRNFNPPYSKPDPSSANLKNIRTLIPSNVRQRMDIVRSYASTILNQTDQYPIHDLTNRVLAFDPVNPLHNCIPIGTYQVVIPTLTQRPILPKHQAQWDLLHTFLLPGEKRMMSHKLLRHLLHLELLTLSDVLLICATDVGRQSRSGQTLVNSLQSFVKRVYQCEALQDEDSVAKSLVNHLIGLCNGTSVIHSGTRYVFRNLQHLWTLLTNSIAEDQMQRIKIMHSMGFDTMWQRSFDYYEIDMSGVAYKSLHFQPVYNMVLEDQAMAVFHRALLIPPQHLIQINIDAIEYSTIDYSATATNLIRKSTNTSWVDDLKATTLSKEEYKSQTPTQLIENYTIGKWREEALRDESKANMYYYDYAKHSHMESQKYWAVSNFTEVEWTKNHNKPLPLLECEDIYNVILDWKNAMTVVVPSLGGVDDTLNSAMCSFFTEASRSGILITGPAGTGKTHCIKKIQNQARSMKMEVVCAAFTHAACVQMGPQAVTLHSLLGLDDKQDTRACIALSNRFASQLRNLNIDLFIIDEISMLPVHLLEVLFLFHRSSPKTRFCLVGDFNQLPPVEPLWDRSNTDPDYSYFDNTDIFPYLLFDRVQNTHGTWIQLHECMRSQDPIMCSIAANPKSVVNLSPDDFPMPSVGVPIWRFISWRNSTRKATNHYVGYRYLECFPTVKWVHLNLEELYVEQKINQRTSSRTIQRPRSDNVSSTPNAIPTQVQYDHDDIRKQFWTGYRPNHWRFLQNFTYAENMEVVCRNTMKEWIPANDVNSSETTLAAPQCVNNRRAIIVDINTTARTVSLVWKDQQTLHFAASRSNLSEDHFVDSTEESALDTSAGSTQPSSYKGECVTLSFHDFAFNFVPGFCITAHMAQGETIQEHCGILEWSDMCKQPKMAYVALTRGQSSNLLHIVPPYSEPWALGGINTGEVKQNILRKLFHSYRYDSHPLQVCDIGVADVLDYLDPSHSTLSDHPIGCSICSNPMQLTKYPFKSNQQFCIVPVRDDAPLSLTNFTVCCDACRAARLTAKQQAKRSSV
jgi:hypothetical protein